MAFLRLVVTNSIEDRRVQLDGAVTTLGRSATQDVVLGEAVVSRQHAVIAREGVRYVLIDQESTHGTFVNGVRVRRALLGAGDVLQLGGAGGPRSEFHDLSGVGSQSGLETRGSSGSSSSKSAAARDLLSSLSELSVAAREAKAPAPEMVQLNWLLTAARRLNEVGAIDDILGALLQSTLELTGLERGFVFIAAQGEMVLRRGRDKAGAAIEDDSTISRRAVREAVTSGAPFSISDTFADDLAAEWSSLKEHRIRSIYCIPLRGRGEGGLLGLLYLDSQVGPGGLTVVDRQLLEMIATEATALLHNALLAEQEYTARQAREELAVAARIHSGLMATALPRVAYAEIEARSLPCLAIGGDFYDVVALDEAVGITIADVSGKGVSAAIVAATLQGIIHAEMLSGHGLVEIAGLVNRFLCGRSVGKYATMVMLKIHADGRVEYVNCGHVQPVTVYGNEVRRLEAGNLVVGLIEGAGYEAAEIYLRAGERLLLATDGVTEAEDAEGRLFGDCLDEVLGVTRDLDELLGRVVAFQETAGAGGFQDDCTLLEVRYTGG